MAALRRAGAAAELQIVPGEGHRMTTGGEGIEPLGGRSNFVAFFTRSLLVADAAP